MFEVLSPKTAAGGVIWNNVFIKFLQNSQENNRKQQTKDSYRCFPENFVKLLRTSSLQNTSQQVLLPDDFLSSWNYQQTKGTKFRDDH